MKTIKKVLSCSLVVALSVGILSAASFAYSDDSKKQIPPPDVKKAEIKMTIGQPQMDVNGVKMPVDPGKGTAPIIANDRTMLPLRAIIESLDGKVEWNNSEKKIRLVVDGKVIELWLNNPYMKVNGENKEIDPGRGTIPQIMNDRTMVPIRAIMENIGGEVNWDPDTNGITIKY
jgi:hypothetical protein